MENTDFKKVLEFCEKEKLYFGEGNPNAKILFVGQEIGFGDTKEKEPSIDEIIKRAEKYTNENLCNWFKHCMFGIEQYLKNMEQQKTNPTWSSYQKIFNCILGRDINEKHFDFLNDSFITEFSQLSLPKSSYLKNNKEFFEIKKQSINERKKLFIENDFFKNFPIIIMACGHYPKDFDFDIQGIFNVEFIEKKNYNDYWYNIHYNKDFETQGVNKVLIHTRQLSNFRDKKANYECLFSKIAELCKPFYK